MTDRRTSPGSQLDEDLAAGAPLAYAIRRMMRTTKVWTGTVSGLLDLLGQQVGDHKPARWPTTPQALTGALRRHATALRTAGIAARATVGAGGTGPGEAAGT